MCCTHDDTPFKTLVVHMILSITHCQVTWGQWAHTKNSLFFIQKKKSYQVHPKKFPFFFINIQQIYI